MPIAVRSGPTERTLARRSPCVPQGDLLSLAADKDYDDMSFREELRAKNVRPLIKHRVFALYDHAHNARIQDELYNQRSICEIMNSVIKRSYGSAVRARVWYRQFREDRKSVV